MRSGNPILRDDTFTRHEVTSGAEMTLPGTVNKTAILLALTLISALWVWNRFSSCRIRRPSLPTSMVE